MSDQRNIAGVVAPSVTVGHHRHLMSPFLQSFTQCGVQTAVIVEQQDFHLSFHNKGRMRMRIFRPVLLLVILRNHLYFCV